MARKIFGKVVWVGRTASTVFGLALVMALVLGVATTALAGNLDPLKIGSLKNVATKTTQLLGKVATGSAFVVKNPSGGSALGLEVNAGQAPLTVNADAGKATNLDADKLDGKDSADFLGKTEKAADADKLDNLESSAFGIRTEHNREQSSACDTPNVNNNCAPVTVVVPPGKTYHVSVWSSMSWTGTSAAQDMEYCVYRIAVGGGAQGSHCITPFSILNRITLPANQRAAASVSGETTLGPGTWQLATTVAPLASQVTDTDRNWIITKVMIRDASAPAPTIQ